MADLAYCTPADVLAVLGQLGQDLRTDDVANAGAHVAQAIDWGSGQVDFFCARYAPAVLAENRWIKGVTEIAAVLWLTWSIWTIALAT